MSIQSNCRLAIKLDNNPNAIYTPGAKITGNVFLNSFFNYKNYLISSRHRTNNIYSFCKIGTKRRV